MHSQQGNFVAPVGIAVLVILILIGARAELVSVDEPLLGTAWTLVAYGPVDGQLKTVVADPDRDLGPYEMMFLKEGGKWRAGASEEHGLAASDGCLDAWAAFAIAGDGTLLTGGWTSTLLDCSHVPPGGPAFLKNLQDAIAYDLISDDSLRIYHREGLEVLVFRSAASSNNAGDHDFGGSSVRFASAAPNPFRESVTLHFTVDQPRMVRIIVYDVLGREVAALIKEDMPAGSHSVTWNASAVPSGRYIARLYSGGHGDSQQLTLVR